MVVLPFAQGMNLHGLSYRLSVRIGENLSTLPQKPGEGQSWHGLIEHPSHHALHRAILCFDLNQEWGRLIQSASMVYGFEFLTAYRHS
jgi:hypothetical protein